MSPTARTLQQLRKMGMTAQVVEKWNPHSHTRLDLFGCIDLIAMLEGEPLLGIQACAGASHATRMAKAMAEPRLVKWLRTGCLFQVWSWSKRGPRGKRKIWTVRRSALRLTPDGAYYTEDVE